MTFRKNLSALLLLLMLSMQFALAQHATVHFSEDPHFSVVQHKDHSPDHPKDKFCETCLLGKQFSVAYHAARVVVFAASLTEVSFVQIFETAARFDFTRVYDARGPPHLLS